MLCQFGFRLKTIRACRNIFVVIDVQIHDTLLKSQYEPFPINTRCHILISLSPVVKLWLFVDRKLDDNNLSNTADWPETRVFNSILFIDTKIRNFILYIDPLPNTCHLQRSSEIIFVPEQ